MLIISHNMENNYCLSSIGQNLNVGGSLVYAFSFKEKNMHTDSIIIFFISVSHKKLLFFPREREFDPNSWSLTALYTEYIIFDYLIHPLMSKLCLPSVGSRIVLSWVLSGGDFWLWNWNMVYFSSSPLMFNYIFGSGLSCEGIRYDRSL